MPEPISIISVTALALSAAKRTKEFVDGIINAPNAVTATSRDLEALSTILTLLFTQLQDPVFKDVQALDPIVTMLEAPLKNCTEETEKLQALLKPFIKPSGAAKTGKWTRFTFKYREADITTIQQRLSNYRASLDAAVGIAVLIISARSSQNVQLAGTGIDTIQRRIQRLLLHAGLDSSTALTSSYAASEILDSSNDTRIADWLHETETVADVDVVEYVDVVKGVDVVEDDDVVEDEIVWSPDIMIGIDVGATCTGVAYSLAPDFQPIIIFNEWPIHDRELPQDNVKTTVAYDQFGKLLKHEFGLDSYLAQKEISVQKWFWFCMNLNGTHSASEVPLVYCKDFLSCLYYCLNVHFEKILPQWNQRAIEFVFSIPEYYTTGARQHMEILIKAAGFGASSKHQVSIITAEQAILSTVTLPKKASTVLICDAGGRELCISTYRISSDAGEPIMKVIDSYNFSKYEGFTSTYMDIHAGRIMNGNLLQNRSDIDSIFFEVNLLRYYGQEFVERYRRDWEVFKRCYSPGSVTGPNFVLSLPDVDVRMTSAEVQDIFDRASKQLVGYIERRLRHARVQHDLHVDLDCIVLSGGLGASPYIQWKIQNHFAGEIEVLVDAEAGTAATRGLVVARLQELGIVQKGEQEIRRSRE